MSFITNKSHIAVKRLDIVKLKINSAESGEGALGAEHWAQAIIKLAVVFIIGIVILQGVVDNTGMNNTSAPFYSLMVSVKSNITSGYILGSLMVLVVGAAAIMSYLGFM